MVLVITLILGINVIFTFLSFDNAVSIIVIFDFYVISGFMILGYIKVFYGFASIMLVQFECELIKGPQKNEVRNMTLMIGLIFLMIIQKMAIDVVVFNNYNIDDVHIPIIFRAELTYGIIGFISRIVMISSFLIQIKMVTT